MRSNTKETIGLAQILICLYDDIQVISSDWLFITALQQEHKHSISKNRTNEIIYMEIIFYNLLTLFGVATFEVVAIPSHTSLCFQAEAASSSSHKPTHTVLSTAF